MKKELKIERNESWVYTLLLTALSILISATRRYTFNIYNFDISYSIIFIPAIYFLTNYILKKYNYKKTLKAIIISSILLAIYMIIMLFAFGKKIDYITIASEACPLLVSQIVNLTIFQFILVNTKNNYILTLLTYLFSIVIYFLVYTLIKINIVVMDSYWEKYFITIILDSLISLPIADIDTKINRGN